VREEPPRPVHSTAAQARVLDGNSGVISLVSTDVPGLGQARYFSNSRAVAAQRAVTAAFECAPPRYPGRPKLLLRPEIVAVLKAREAPKVRSLRQ
jgi:hypothetical protein